MNVMEWDAEVRDVTIGSRMSKDIRKWNNDERTASGSSMPCSVGVNIMLIVVLVPWYVPHTALYGIDEWSVRSAALAILGMVKGLRIEVRSI